VVVAESGVPGTGADDGSIGEGGFMESDREGLLDECRGATAGFIADAFTSIVAFVSAFVVRITARHNETCFELGIYFS